MIYEDFNNPEHQSEELTKQLITHIWDAIRMKIKIIMNNPSDADGSE